MLDNAVQQWSGIWDVHSHILPVDDGVRNLKDALETIRSSYQQNVRCMIATPHSMCLRGDETRARKLFEKLSGAVSKTMPDMRLVFGCEILCTKEYLPDILTRLSNGCFPTLGETKSVLIEFHENIDEEEILACVDSISDAGWKLVIAHVERYACLFERPDMIRQMHERGVLFQVNAYSLADERDTTIKDRAIYLLKERLIDLLGSDTHGMTHRPPMWDNAVKLLTEMADPAYVQRILRGNATRLLGKMSANDLRALRDRNCFLDGMLGLAAVDVLEVPDESSTREQMRNNSAGDMIDYNSQHMPEDCRSDGTSMALCIAVTLCHHDDPNDIMSRFAEWKQIKKCTAAGVRFDVGGQNQQSIDRFFAGLDLLFCGNDSVTGDGSQVRMIPISLYQCIVMGCDEKKINAFLNGVHDVSRLTHARPYSLVSCCILTMILHEWLFYRTEEDTLEDICNRGFDKARSFYLTMGGAYANGFRENQMFVRPGELKQFSEDQIKASRYVPHTLHVALWCLLKTDSYRDAVLRTVKLGGDTDTTTAVTGALAGVIYGRNEIPQEWLQKLKHQDFVEEICRELNQKVFSGWVTPEIIDSFTKDNAYMAMKAKCAITVDELTYSNLQAAWLAQSVPFDKRSQYVSLTSHRARRMVKQMLTDPGWDEKKMDVLYELCLKKFTQNQELAQKILETGDARIVYDTTGAHDNELGLCKCERCKKAGAMNLYGEILMRVRKELQRL